MSDSSHTHEGATQFAQIAARAIKLYSRPTVAMEVVRLTEQPLVSTSALRECIEQDPALTCKILRVVNSSLFGLSGRVGDLDQALSLLGIKPLKLLVLGFSLPDNLFAEVAARELRWYWTNTLTRAVAARLLAEQLWEQPGDEAFIAGLLEDIGVLVMLRELGQPYAKFLSAVLGEHGNLESLERATLGFDHRQLTAMLLSRWQLPQKLIDAVSAPREPHALVQRPASDGDLPRVLHLADLVCQLVRHRRVAVLSELLQAGREYRDLTAARLTEIVRELQPQVDQLAAALALDLDGDRDYSQVLRDAHEQIGVLAEEFVAPADERLVEEDAYARLSKQSCDLTSAMRSFLDSGDTRQTPTPQMTKPTATRRDRPTVPPTSDAESQLQFRHNATLRHKLNAAATRCRRSRQEVSLLLFELRQQGDSFGREEAGRHLRRSLAHACRRFDDDQVGLVSLSDLYAAAVVSGCDRSAAIAAAHEVVHDLTQAENEGAGVAVAKDAALAVGVATASFVARNFDVALLIECAERCLGGARSCGISAVKSIEV